MGLETIPSWLRDGLAAAQAPVPAFEDDVLTGCSQEVDGFQRNVQDAHDRAMHTARKLRTVSDSGHSQAIPQHMLDEVEALSGEITGKLGKLSALGSQTAGIQVDGENKLLTKTAIALAPIVAAGAFVLARGRLGAAGGELARKLGARLAAAGLAHKVFRWRMALVEAMAKLRAGSQPPVRPDGILGARTVSSRVPHEATFDELVRTKAAHATGIHHARLMNAVDAVRALKDSTGRYSLEGEIILKKVADKLHFSNPHELSMLLDNNLGRIHGMRKTPRDIDHYDDLELILQYRRNAQMDLPGVHRANLAELIERDYDRFLYLENLVRAFPRFFEDPARIEQIIMRESFEALS